MPSSSPASSTSTCSPTSPTSSDHFFSLPPSRKQRVSAEHTLNRVRENQRRHRARRKDHIATLEAKLAETEKQLAQARAEIEELRRENQKDVVRPVFCDHEDGDDASGAVAKGEEEAMRKGSLVESTGDMEMTPQAPPEPSTMPPEMASFLGDLSVYMADNLPSPIPSLSILNGPPPCCEDIPAPSTPSVSRSSSPSPECSSCHQRPAPLPSESTTLCAQAYAMIQQQNFRGIDATTIRLWLYQGYRRAQREGEGCRVENGALFRLLDYISGL